MEESNKCKKLRLRKGRKNSNRGTETVSRALNGSSTLHWLNRTAVALGGEKICGFSKILLWHVQQNMPKGGFDHFEDREGNGVNCINIFLMAESPHSRGRLQRQETNFLFTRTAWFLSGGIPVTHILKDTYNKPRNPNDSTFTMQ